MSGRSVFGFVVDSSFPLRFLRQGSSSDVLTVDEAPSESLAQTDRLIHEWKFKDPTGDVSGRLYAVGSQYHVWFADTGWFRVDPAARRITVPHEADPVMRELRTLGVPTTLCSVTRGDMSLHAAAVEIGGGAILLAAPGQHGKTTLALAFHERGYRVLSEDTACCRFDGEPVLHPGPAVLRVRPDMYKDAPPTGTTVAAKRPDRIVLRVDDDHAGSAAPIPIRGVLFLRSSDDGVRLEPVEKVRSLPDLYALSFRVGGSESAADTFGRVSRLASGTTIWNLFRPLRRDNLDEVIARVVGAVTISSAR